MPARARERERETSASLLVTRASVAKMLPGTSASRALLLVTRALLLLSQYSSKDAEGPYNYNNYNNYYYYSCCCCCYCCCYYYDDDDYYYDYNYY